MNIHRLYQWQAINRNGAIQEDISLATEKNKVYEYMLQHGL